MDDFLAPGRFIDSEAPEVVRFARAAAGDSGDDTDRVLRLFGAVRDQLRYDPYVDMADPANFRASSVLQAGHGFCIGKAALLAGCARAIGVPARVGYADVRNHLTSRRMYEHIQTDVFVWHSYTDLYLDGRWVKATPAFDLALCERFGVLPLEFDGREDSVFQPYDRAGRRHMEYVCDRGVQADVPMADIVATFEREYPRLVEAGESAATTRFRDEAGQTPSA